jgi:hypothetical protein
MGMYASGKRAIFIKVAQSKFWPTFLIDHL